MAFRIGLVGSRRYKLIMNDRADILAEIRSTLRQIDSRHLSTAELLDLSVLLRCFLPESAQVARSGDQPLLRVV